MRSKPKEQRAVAIRDVVVPHVMELGKWERIGCSKAPGGDVPSLRHEGDGFAISLRTPFQKCHAPLELLKYQAALRQQGVPMPYLTLPWQLEIWPRTRQEIVGKVLNIEWDDYGTFVITSFRRGPWEDAILSWGTVGTSSSQAAPAGIVLSPDVRRPSKHQRCNLHLVTSTNL